MSDGDLTRIPEPLKRLDWKQADPDRVFTDGETLLVAVGVRGNLDKWHYEFAVVTVHCDESFFAIDLDGDPWGWEWDDVDFYVQVRR